MAEKLSDAQIKTHLAALDGWHLNAKGEIAKTYKRKNFLDGLAFVTQIAVIAEGAGHHPDVLLTWPSVGIAITTHDAGGLTEKDFALAKAIDALA